MEWVVISFSNMPVYARYLKYEDKNRRDMRVGAGQQKKVDSLVSLM